MTPTTPKVLIVDVVTVREKCARCKGTGKDADYRQHRCSHCSSGVVERKVRVSVEVEGCGRVSEYSYQILTDIILPTGLKLWSLGINKQNAIEHLIKQVVTLIEKGITPDGVTCEGLS